MLWYKFCPIWGRFGYMLLTTIMMVSVGNVLPLGTKRYELPLIVSKKLLVSTQNNRSVVSISIIFWGSFGHFYALTEFSMHLCA